MFSPTDLTGEFSSFTFNREIATGAQGTVFIANVLGNTVAVKALRLPSRITKEEQCKHISTLEDVMLKVKSLRHLNIVQHFHTAYTVALLPLDVRCYYITMELCHVSLAREARKAPINGFHLQKWARDILSGLSYLHDNRILHRDLKGDNIFLSTEDRDTCVLKIGDLGDIKHLPNSFLPVSYNHGTCAFMAPEMIRGPMSSRFSIVYKSDIWSFGCVLIEMLTGELPQFVNRKHGGAPIRFTEKGYGTMIIFHVGNGGRPEIFDTWPSSVRDVIDLCLKHDPELRPSTPQLLQSIMIEGSPPVWERDDSTELPVLPSNPVDTNFDGNKNMHKPNRITKQDIGKPTNFRHVSHIGFDPDNGFKGWTKGHTDPIIEKFFRRAAIDIKNVKTAASIKKRATYPSVFPPKTQNWSGARGPKGSDRGPTPKRLSSPPSRGTGSNPDIIRRSLFPHSKATTRTPQYGPGQSPPFPPGPSQPLNIQAPSWPPRGPTPVRVTPPVAAPAALPPPSTSPQPSSPSTSEEGKNVRNALMDEIRREEGFRRLDTAAHEQIVSGRNRLLNDTAKRVALKHVNPDNIFFDTVTGDTSPQLEWQQSWQERWRSTGQPWKFTMTRMINIEDTRSNNDEWD